MSGNGGYSTQCHSRAIHQLLREAEGILSKAGVASPRVDAELLAAHVLGVPRGRLPMVSTIDPPLVEALRTLVHQRATRVPLQHLTGTAAMGDIEVAVGPGVFVPRPETEQLLVWGLAAVADVPHPLVVDLCTGSGALALAVAHARPDAEVHAVELDPAALRWARHNANRRAAAGDTPIALHHGDVADPTLLSALRGRAHLVLCNPPYVPEGADLPPEVSQHDPPSAVFAGQDGLAVIPAVVRTGSRLLRAGGSIAIEHDESHAQAVPALLAAHSGFIEVAEHLDLSGRPRFATARHP